MVELLGEVSGKIAMIKTTLAEQGEADTLNEFKKETIKCSSSTRRREIFLCFQMFYSKQLQDLPSLFLGLQFYSHFVERDIQIRLHLEASPGSLCVCACREGLKKTIFWS